MDLQNNEQFTDSKSDLIFLFFEKAQPEQWVLIIQNTTTGKRKYHIYPDRRV